MLEQKKILYLAALEQSLGNITEATNSIGISRDCHYKWLQSDDEFREAYESIDFLEMLKDLIRGKLRQKLNENDTAVIIFMAKAILKYAERQEIDVSKIPITWIEEKYTDETNTKAIGGD